MSQNIYRGIEAGPCERTYVTYVSYIYEKYQCCPIEKGFCCSPKGCLSLKGMKSS